MNGANDVDELIVAMVVNHVVPELAPLATGIGDLKEQGIELDAKMDDLIEWVKTHRH